MPFRAKAKAIFRRSKNSDDFSASSSSSSSERWPSNVYRPGEPMPRPKYRKPPTKEHKEHLESFDFSAAWRRRSHQSMYSPMGTRAPSRRNSLFSRKSYTGRPSLSRGNSIASQTFSESGAPRDGRAMHVGGLSRQPTRLEEADGDDDIHNVGLSRVQSHDRPAMFSRPRTAEDQHEANLMNGVTAHDHQPFTEQDLSLALQRTHLAVPQP